MTTVCVSVCVPFWPLCIIVLLFCCTCGTTVSYLCNIVWASFMLSQTADLLGTSWGVLWRLAHAQWVQLVCLWIVMLSQIGMWSVCRLGQHLGQYVVFNEPFLSSFCGALRVFSCWTEPTICSTDCWVGIAVINHAHEYHDQRFLSRTYARVYV